MERESEQGVSQSSAPTQWLQAMRQHMSTGGGKSEAAAYLLEALVEAGVPLMLILTTLLYSAQLSDYRIGKTTVIYIAVPVLLGGFLARQVVQRRLRLEASPLYLPFLIYLAVSALSLIFSGNPARGGEVLLFQVWCFLFYILVFHHFRDATAAAGVLWAVVLTGFIVAVLGLLQYNGVHVLFHPNPQTNLPIATLGNPNFVAHYLEIVIPLTLVMLAIRKRYWERAALVLAFAATCSHMILTTSRAGWLGIGTALLFLLYHWRRRVRWVSGIIMTVVVGALLSPTVGLVLDSVYLEQDKTLHDSLKQIAERTWARAWSSFDMTDYSISQRRIIWADTWDLIRDQPWLGVGPGNYELMLPAYRTVERHRFWHTMMGERINVAYHAHNEYLEFWSESGLPGLLAALWLLGAMLWTGHKYLDERTSGIGRTVTLGCMAGMIATLVHSLFSFNLQDPTPASHFWLLGGLMVAVNRGEAGASNLLLDISLSSRLERALPLLIGALIACIGIWIGLCILLGDVHYVRGRTKLDRDGHPNRAILAFRQAVEQRSWDFAYHHSLGVASLKVGRYAEAEQAFRRSLELHANNAAVLRLLGRTLLQRDRAAEAVPLLQRAIDLEPLEPDNYAWLARAHGKEGDHKRAIGAWEQALSFNLEDGDYLRGIGQAYYAIGRMEEATAILERVVRMRPEDGLGQGNLGVVYTKLGKLDKASAAFQKAIDLMPEEMRWWKFSASVHMRQRQWAAALTRAERALELAPRDVQLQQMAESLRQHLQEGGE